jgi:hypothetical protein
MSRTQHGERAVVLGRRLAAARNARRGFIGASFFRLEIKIPPLDCR